MERCIDQCMLGRTFQFLWAFSRMLEIHLYAMIDLFLSISLGSGCHKHVNTAPIYIWYFSLDHHVYPQREKNAFRLESAVLTGLFFEKLAPFPGKKNSKWREFRWHFFVSEWVWSKGRWKTLFGAQIGENAQIESGREGEREASSTDWED